MGSLTQLSVGRLEIDWGKNFNYGDHSALFQSSDISKIPYFYLAAQGQLTADEFGDLKFPVRSVEKDGFSKPLTEVIDRINLLGYSRANCEQEFRELASLNNFDAQRFKFEELATCLSEIDVVDMSSDYGEDESFGKFFRRQLFDRLKLANFASDPEYVRYHAGEAMENISAYTILQLISKNDNAKHLPITWRFADLEEGGYAKRSELIKPLDRSSRFLIVTEGTSDSKIVQHAFNLLKPHIADFFDYVDMEDGYPFTGTGNVFRFLQGLIGISAMNNIIIIFDNDAEGSYNLGRCQGLSLPPNIKVVKLPNIEKFRDFPTIGPGGVANLDINGKAVAIECFLDLDTNARVRWTSYNRQIDAYQGELEGKENHTRAFLTQRVKSPTYDYSHLEALLSQIVDSCMEMSVAAVASKSIL